MYRRSGFGVLAALAVSLTLPAIAAARTKIVYAGPPPSINKIAAKLLPKAFQATYNPDISSFFGRRTTINVGDTVSFRIRGFHDVDLPGATGTALPFIIPGATVTGVNDAAGNPFWFNGHVPSLGLDPQLIARSTAHAYNGSTRIVSGIASPKPLNVRFTKAGKYQFFCDIHPGMVGYVVVKAKGKRVPTARQDAAALTAQATADVKAARKLVRTKLPADTVSLGESASDGVELYQMFPAKLTVNAGTTVTFKMSRGSRETHTASFGPVSYLTSLAKSFQGAPMFAPAATYPSDPSQPLTLTPTSHGNGFANTGVLDSAPVTKQIGPSSKIDFTTPGTYHFVCLIHPFMQGTIIVK